MYARNGMERADNGSVHAGNGIYLARNESVCARNGMELTRNESMSIGAKGIDWAERGC